MHPLFGTKHLILVGVSIALIVALWFFTRRMRFQAVCKYLFYVGIVSEIVKIFYYIVQNEENWGGVLPKTDLPFHLCSIQILFIAVLNLSQNEKLKRFLLSFMYPSCLIGGVAALIIATDSSRNGFFIITAQYFLYHIALVVFALHIVASKEHKLTMEDYKNCLKMLLVMMFFAFYINSMVYDGASNINFMYVASPPQAGLPFLTEEYGWLVYIAHYASLVIISVTLCYLGAIIRFFKERKGDAPQQIEAAEQMQEEITV